MPDPHTYHNQELLLRIAGGDEPAFTVLFDRFQPVIYTYVLRLTRSDVLAQEIVQDTFLKAWIKRSTLPAVDNIGGWLYRVAANLASDVLSTAAVQYRKEATLGSHPAPFTDPFTSTEEYLLQQKYLVLVQEALASLPDRQRQTFELIKLQGHTRESAAALLGISPESVKTHLAIALQKIRAYCTLRSRALGLLLFLWANR